MFQYLFDPSGGDAPPRAPPATRGGSPSLSPSRIYRFHTLLDRQTGRQTKKGPHRGCKGIECFCCNNIFLVFRNLSTPEPTNNKYGPQIRILGEFSSREPAPNVWKQKSRSKKSKLFTRIKKVGLRISGCF